MSDSALFACTAIALFSTGHWIGGIAASALVVSAIAGEIAKEIK